jgi:hypothetical protein
MPATVTPTLATIQPSVQASMRTLHMENYINLTVSFLKPH